MNRELGTHVDVGGAVGTLLRDHLKYHSDLQIDSFILGNSGCTEYGLYRQTLMELYSRWCSLGSRAIRRERLLLKIRRLSRRIEGALDAHGPESDEALRADVDLAQARLHLEQMDRSIRDGEREFKRFLGHAIVLKRRIGEIDDQRRAELEREEWVHHLRRRAAIDYVREGRVSAATMECVLALPLDLRLPLLDRIAPNRQAELAAWVREFETPLPTLPRDLVEVLRDYDPKEDLIRGSLDRGAPLEPARAQGA